MLITKPPVEIDDALLMLGSTEYPLYLVKGDGECAIFEGGTGPMGPLLHEQLSEFGIVPDSIRRVVIPHAHPDHVMAVPFLRGFLRGAEVLASEAAAATLANEKAVGFFSKIDGAITDSLLRKGIIREEHRPEPLEQTKIAVDRTIGQRDTVEVGGRGFRVLSTPGHSECSLSFHDPAAGVLLISDAAPYYFPEDGTCWPVYFTSYTDFLGSMRRLQELGAGLLCLGHHAVVRGADDVAAFFDRSIAATEAYHHRIVDEAKAGRSVREIAGQLGAEVYEKTQILPLDFFQKNCGLMVKLSLKHEGIAVEK